MFDKSYIDKAVVLVPIIHVAVCGIYISGYSLAFGGGIGSLFSASDFVTITLDRLVYIYALSLALPFTLIAWRHGSGSPYAEDEIHNMEDSDTKEKATRALARIRTALFMFVVCLALFALCTLICQIIFNTRRDYALFVQLIFVAVTPVWWKIANKNSIAGLKAEFIWSFTIFIATVFSVGMERGDLDRRGPSAMFERNMKCGQLTIIRPVGERFIVTNQNSQRYLVNEKCETIISIPSTMIIDDVPLIDHLRRIISD